MEETRPLLDATGVEAFADHMWTGPFTVSATAHPGAWHVSRFRDGGFLIDPAGLTRTQRDLLEPRLGRTTLRGREMLVAHAMISWWYAVLVLGISDPHGFMTRDAALFHLGRSPDLSNHEKAALIAARA